MENWKKVILGVALSFMAFFTCIGYAALEDTLTISGILNASMPEEIFFAGIDPIKETGVTASISGLTKITVSNGTNTEATATFAITIINNSGDRKVCKDWKISDSSALTDNSLLNYIESTEIGKVTASDDDAAPYYSGADALVVEADKDEEVTLYVKVTLPANTTAVTISYEFVSFIYSITYINNEIELDARYVYNNEKTISTQNEDLETKIDEQAKEDYGENVSFIYWMNAGSTQIESVPAGNEEDIKLYPKFDTLYTAIFVSQDGILLDWMMFTTDQKDELIEFAEKTKEKAPETAELEFDYWVVQTTDDEGNNTVITLEEYTNTEDGKLPGNDVTIYPVYLYKGDVNLIPIDSDSDGVTNYYQVAGYSDPNGQALVEIPASVNGVDVTEINADAFSSFDGIHSVVIPSTVTSIGENAFAEGNSFGTGEQLTIYFEGKKSDWDTLTAESSGWSNGIGTGSRVFFLKDGMVDTTQSYLEVTSDGGFLGIGAKYSWSEKNDFADVKEKYTGYCDCKVDPKGDTAHIYVKINDDGTETVLERNESGTPVDGEYEITYNEGVFGYGAGLKSDANGTYKRYRPDRSYWTNEEIS